MFLLGLGPAIIFALFGPDLFTLVFGEPWREAGAYARILSGAMLLRFCVGPVFYILTIMRKQRMQLIADSIGLLFLGIGIAAAHFYSLPPRQAVAFYGIAVVVTYSLLFYFSLRSVKQLTGRE